MKMTPEHKAFYEYGRARAWLKAHRSKKYFVDVPSMGLYVWHLERDLHGLDALIRDAWQKRAARRAFIPERERFCRNCKHWRLRAFMPPCYECMDAEPHINWEPRKVGK